MAIGRRPIAHSAHAIIDRRVLEDRRLSWTARGVLAFLKTHPGGGALLASHLGHADPNERQMVQDALRELEQVGYITRQRAS